MAENWILDDYSAALEQFAAAMSQPAEHDLIKAGCIQYFEFSFELAWKSIKLLSAQLGLEECLSPKASIAIDDGETLFGEIPKPKMKLVQAWLEIHREDLMADWKLAVNGEPTHRIKPLE